MAKDLKIDDCHFTYYAQDGDLLLGYVTLVRPPARDIGRRHTAIIQIVIDSETDNPKIIPSLLKHVYDKADGLGIEKLYTHEVDKNQHLITNLINVGFVKEAVIKKMAIFNGIYCDVFILSKFL